MPVLRASFRQSCVAVCLVLMQTVFLQANSVSSDCSLCSSKNCISHARGIIKNLKSDVDPCEDFYSFACGRFLERFGNDDTRSVYDDTWHSLQITLKELLENMQSQGEGTASEKLKTVYDTCINKETSVLRAVSDALDFLKGAGLQNWTSVDLDLTLENLSEVLGKLAAYGEFAFVTFKKTPYVSYSKEDNGLSPILVLPGNYLLNSKIKEDDLQNSIWRIQSYFNASKNELEASWKNFKSIEDIGIQLQNEEESGTNSDCSRSSSSYVTVNCSGETRNSLKVLCGLWKSAVKTGNFYKHYSENIIHISCRWNHFHYMDKIIPTIANVNQRSLAEYLSMRFFLNHLDDLNLYFYLSKKSYPEEDKASSNKTSSKDGINRWEYCVEWVIKSMNLALGYKYTKEVFKTTMEKDVLNIIETYMESLGSALQSQSWIDETLQHHLRRQIKKLEIGFKATLETYRNRTRVSDFYYEYHPTKESFFKNMLEFGRFSLINQEKSHFNSFYSSSDPYTMDFGFALFLPPTYSYGLPKLWNYATLGLAISHELSHNLKFLYDLVPLDDQTDTSLNYKLQCYIQQYSNFIMEKTGKKMNSSEAKEEIIADNLGFELTEKVAVDIMDTSDKLNLPGLKYNAMQLMYISFAQDSCAALSKRVEEEFYSSKPHNLQKLRILSILQNSRMFSDIFNCSKTNTMNPEKKCDFFYETYLN